MKAEIISIGTEHLLGSIVDTNAPFISRQLSLLGINLFYRQTVGDNPERLRCALRRAFARADMVIAIGGLGPTVDDITIPQVAQFLGKKLVHAPLLSAHIKRYFKKQGFPIPPGTIRGACIPAGSIIFKNDFGTAPGIYLRFKKKHLILLPGPPVELVSIWKKYLAGFLKKNIAPQEILSSKTIKIVGRAESAVNELVADLLMLKAPLTVGIYAKLGEVHLVITAKGQSQRNRDALINPVRDGIYRRLGEYIFGEDSETLESAVGKILSKKHITLSVAESATGGLIASRITDVPGASQYFLGGFVTYSTLSKIKLLHIKKEMLKKSGAVSEKIACEMAQKVRARTGSDIGLSVTGIAGPGGGSTTTPLGLHYIGLFDGKHMFVKRFIFAGTRMVIKGKASQETLAMLWRYLKTL